MLAHQHGGISLDLLAPMLQRSRALAQICKPYDRTLLHGDAKRLCCYSSRNCIGAIASTLHACSRQLPDVDRKGSGRRHVDLIVTRSAKKGFGTPKIAAAAETCPCGSKHVYKECCEPAHSGAVVPATPEAALRARFSAYSKRKEAYLLSTFHKDYHTFGYKTEPGGAAKQLKDDVAYAAKNFKYSNFKIRSVEGGDEAAAAASGQEEVFVTFSYSSQHRTQPSTNVTGTHLIERTVEKSRFVRQRKGDAGQQQPWQLISYELIEWPVWLTNAKEAELSAKELQEQQQLGEQTKEDGTAAALASAVQ